MRLAQALGVAEHDQVEGIRGYRRAVKKIRCLLLLTAGSLSADKRQTLDACWAALARRLGAFRDMDAREKKLAEIIIRVPLIHQNSARLAWASACGPMDRTMHGWDRREVLDGLTGDTEHLISVTEKIKFADLTPEMVAGSVEHIWNRARLQAKKSWNGRDAVWLHSLRKRVQRTHIALRILRAQSGERGLEFEKRFDDAAKAMGELRDASIIRLMLPVVANPLTHVEVVATQTDHAQKSPTEIPFTQDEPTPSQSTQSHLLEITAKPVPVVENLTAFEILQIQISLAEIQATKEAHKLVVKAFKSDIEKTLRHIVLYMHSL